MSSVEETRDTREAREIDLVEERRPESWLGAGHELVSPGRVKAGRIGLALARLSIGWVFLWAFLDKTFGLGFATPSEGAWIRGGSPTTGYLENATSGPLAGFYQAFAGMVWMDWLFMLSLLAVGVTLLLGIGVWFGAVVGSIWLMNMWASALWPANNPFMDDHIVYSIVLITLALFGAGRTWGFGRAWTNTTLVRKNPWLE